MTSFAELKASAKPAQRVVSVCVDHSLNVEHDRLQADLLAARATGGKTLAGNPDERQIAEQLRALEVQMQAKRVNVWVQALPELVFLTLLEEHLPREDNARDAAHGFNSLTFPPVAIAAVSIDPPEGEDGLEKLTVDQAGELYHELMSAADAEALLDAALRDNLIPSRVPFSALASVILTTPEQS